MAIFKAYYSEIVSKIAFRSYIGRDCFLKTSTHYEIYRSSTVAYMIKIHHTHLTTKFLTMKQRNHMPRKFRIGTLSQKIPDLEQIMTLSPAFRNSLARAYPIPEIKIRENQRHISRTQPKTIKPIKSYL